MFLKIITLIPLKKLSNKKSESKTKNILVKHLQKKCKLSKMYKVNRKLWPQYRKYAIFKVENTGII